MIWDKEAQRQYWRHTCSRNFYAFLTYCFGAPERKRKHTWFTPTVHKPLADWFEHHTREWEQWRTEGLQRQKKLAVLVPRRVGKTTCITQAGSLWLQLQDPDLSIGIGSESLDQAEKFFHTVRSVMSDPSDSRNKFPWLYGNWQDNNRLWNKGECVHAARRDIARKEPSFFIWGVKTGLTSKHVDVLFFDDPTSYDAMRMNSNWLQVVNEHTDTLIPVLEEDGMLIYVGTRYGGMDHFGRSFKFEGVRSVSGHPETSHLQVQEDGEWDVYYLSGEDRDGEPAIPSIWSKRSMDMYRARNPVWYASQVKNDPTNTAYNPLTSEDIENLMVDDNLVPYNALRYTIHLDTAFKRPDRQFRGDESVYQVWGHTSDGSGIVYYIEGKGSNAWDSKRMVEELILLVQRYRRAGRKVMYITDEPNPGGKDGLWDNYLLDKFHEAGLHVPGGKLIIVNRTPVNKTAKIIEASAFWKDRYVRLPKGAPGLARLVAQMSSIGTPPDDWADCAIGPFHKDIYQPLHKLGRIEEEDTSDQRRPWDNILKDWRERNSGYRERASWR